MRSSLGVSEKRLLECAWESRARAGKTPLTQEVGLAIHLAGLEGMLVRSAADPSGQNLVVFVENLQTGSTVTVVAAGRSPELDCMHNCMYD